MTIPPESCFGAPNTRNVENPETLSSPCTHSSFLTTKGPLTSGNSVPPARPPNPPGKERPRHLTSSAIRLQWRGYRQLAILHTFFLFKAVVTPNQIFWAAILSHFSGQEKNPCPTEGQFPQPSCADQSRRMLSLFRLKNRARIRSPCGPYFPGTFRCVGAVRKRTLSHGSKKGQTLSHKGLFHISGTMPESPPVLRNLIDIDARFLGANFCSFPD